VRPCGRPSAPRRTVTVPAAAHVRQPADAAAEGRHRAGRCACLDEVTAIQFEPGEFEGQAVLVVVRRRFLDLREHAFEFAFVFVDQFVRVRGVDVVRFVSHCVTY